MAAFLGDLHQRDGFLVELVAAGLDARQVENLVDEPEQVNAGIVDVVGIVLVGAHGVGAEQLVLHHLGKAENGVERRAQLMAHLGEEPRLGDVGGFRMAARLVGFRLRLLEFADQRILLRARLQGGELGGVEPVGEQPEIAQRREREPRQHVAVHAARQQIIDGDRVVSGTVVANTAIGRLEPSMLDTATTSSITNTSMMSELVRSSAGWTRLIVQASPNRRSSTTKVSRARLIAVSLGRLRQEFAALHHARELDREHHRHPHSGPGDARPVGGDEPDRGGQQDDAERARQAVLRVLAQQLVIERRPRSGRRGQPVAGLAHALRRDPPLPGRRAFRSRRRGQWIGVRKAHHSAGVVEKHHNLAQNP